MPTLQADAIADLANEMSEKKFNKKVGLLTDSEQVTLIRAAHQALEKMSPDLRAEEIRNRAKHWRELGNINAAKTH